MAAVITAFIGLCLIIAGFTLSLIEFNADYLLLVGIGFFMTLSLHDW